MRCTRQRNRCKGGGSPLHRKDVPRLAKRQRDAARGARQALPARQRVALAVGDVVVPRVPCLACQHQQAARRQR